MLDNDTTARLAVNGRRADVGHHVPAEGLIHLDLGGHVVSLRNELAFAGVEDVDDGGGRVVAPMHGVLLELLVAPGERVEKGSRLAVLEAMKMSHVIVAELVGTVTQLHATPGTQIAAGDAILVIEPDAE